MSISYVRTEEAPKLPAPRSQKGIMGWLWHNIFASMSNFSTFKAALSSTAMILLSIGFGYAMIWLIWNFLDFTIFSAVWTDPKGIKKDACNIEGAGMCWPYIYEWFESFMIGNEFPESEKWRAYTIFAMLAIGILWLIIEILPFKKWVAAFMLLLFPIIAFVFLNGTPIDGKAGADWTFPLLVLGIGLAIILFGIFSARGLMGEIFQAFAMIFVLIGGALAAFGAIPLVAQGIDAAFGFPVVRTSQWGGLLVTLVVAITGIVASLPLGVLLALGRRSNAPLIKWFCIVFIEVVRGIPLISVLFFASVMLQYFLPSDFNFNKLLRALVGVALFSAAYMAEVVRGGLQAMPKGQYEGGMSLGLSYWQQMRLIILPQALTTVIPGIVNSFIALFKDTTLVLIISIFDLLGMIHLRGGKDIEWYSPTHAPSGYVFAAMVFWVFCFSMSRYSIHMERKLHRGHR